MKFLIRSIFLAVIVPILISGCGGKDEDRPESIAEPNVSGTPSLKDLYAYEDNTNYEKVLTCSRMFLSSESCDVADIKPIGVDVTGNVSLDDIKNRIVVSHDWMAESFIAALEEIDDQEFLNLFKPLNSIVISYDVRPAFYQQYTASIYIDARYLWRNTEEWESIYQQDDYRSDYQTEFIFDSFGRYVDANTSDYVIWSNTYDADSYNTRTSEQIAPGFFRLLSHELAHANDFLSPTLLASLGDNGRIYHDYIYPENDINDELSEAIPLTSNMLHSAAQIAYRGEDMTDEIRNTSAAEAGIDFSHDGAADLYGYSTDAEDVAMLFEAFMMFKKYGAVRDIAFVTLPSEEDYSCDDYVVKWGQRNRLADSNVKQRAIFSASKILDRDITSDLSSISSEPIDMTPDTGWCAARTDTQSVNVETTGNGLSRGSKEVVYDYRDDRVRH